MKNRLKGLLCSVAAAALAYCLCGAAGARAAEPFDQFVEGLRSMRLHDMALEYLASMRTSDLISPEKRQVISYEEARTYVDAAKVERDLAIKNRFLDSARDKYEEFIKNNSAHPLVATAEMEKGVVLVERGIALREAADRASGADRDNQLAEARQYLTQAAEVFEAARQRYQEEYDTYPRFIPPNQPDLIQKRDSCRTNLIQAQMYNAAGQYEMARTYKEGTADRKRELQKAADAYGKVYEQYRTMIAGLLARIKEAQCYQEMGDTKRALGLYANIVDQPTDNATIRKLRAAAMYKSLECWIIEGRFELAAVKGEEFLIATRPDEANTTDWLAIRYHVAQALVKWAGQFTDKADAGRKKNTIDKAREQLEFVARYPSNFQQLANIQVKELRGIDESNDREPRNFAEAYDRGRQAMDAIALAQSNLSEAMASNNQEAVATAKDELLNARARAARYFRLALDLRDDSADMEQVNEGRFYLCYFMYEDHEFYDAAVLGEFLARKYPNSAGGRQGAKIAMGAYAQEFNATSDPDARAFDRAKMLEMAEFIATRWPDEPETDDARNLLITIYGREGNVDRVMEILASIPEDSPRRADAEVKVGQSLWSKYFELGKNVGEENADPDAATQAERDRLAGEARRLLEVGLERQRKQLQDPGQVDAYTAGGSLSLLQIYVNLGEGDKAVALLEDPVVGPKTLVDEDTKVAQQGKFKEETLKLALRAYVAVQDMDKATAVMNQLEQLVAAAGGAGELTKIYYALGRELQNQVALLRENNKIEELDKVSKGFELFLDRVAQQEQGNSFSMLNWVAETFFSLGEGYSQGEAVVPEQAKTYYTKSAATDKKIIDTAAATPTFAPTADAVLGVRMRKAKAERMLGNFQAAIADINSVLDKRWQLLDAQTEAAQTLMLWGKTDPKQFLLAIAGDGTATDPRSKPGDKLIWGWSKLAAMTQGNEDYKDTYHNARLKLAECYLIQALAAAADERQKLLDRAEQTIATTFNFKQDLGGEDWLPRYDELLKRVQRESKKRADGVAGLKAAAEEFDRAMTPPPAVAAATTAPTEPSAPAPAATPTSESETRQSSSGQVFLVLGMAAVMAVVAGIFIARAARPKRKRKVTPAVQPAASN